VNGAGTVAAAGSRRLGWSLAASFAVHAAMLLLALRVSAPGGPPRPAVVLPVSLVSLAGGGGGGRGPEPPGAAAEALPAPPPPAAAPAPAPTPERARVAKRPVAKKPAPAPVEEPPARAATPAPDAGNGAAGGTGVAGGVPGGDGGVPGGGDGTGGDGSGGARVAYGSNPLPPYPLAARRLGHEGVVLLEVLVAADGRAAEVSVARSSGHATLDESARETVRSRWRFLPARRDGQPVPSRVEVPIRFRLDDARG
jgi:protein TonB